MLFCKNLFYILYNKPQNHWHFFFFTKNNKLWTAKSLCTFLITSLLSKRYKHTFVTKLMEVSTTEYSQDLCNIHLFQIQKEYLSKQCIFISPTTRKPNCACTDVKCFWKRLHESVCLWTVLPTYMCICYTSSLRA